MFREERNFGQILQVFLLLLVICPSVAISNSWIDFMKTAPAEQDWKYFKESTPSFKTGLWNRYKLQGFALKDWAWQWRLAWVQSCHNSQINQDQRKYCKDVIDQALEDKAVVVRDAVSTLLGRSFAETKDPKVIEALVNLFKDPRNIRNGKPLYITKKILFNIHRVAGDKSADIIPELVEQDKDLASYWKMLSSSQSRSNSSKL